MKAMHRRVPTRLDLHRRILAMLLDGLVLSPRLGVFPTLEMWNIE